LIGLAKEALSRTQVPPMAIPIRAIFQLRERITMIDPMPDRTDINSSPSCQLYAFSAVWMSLVILERRSPLWLSPI
jgi:hypothetical protein